jgi:hypothetical protein
VQELLPWIALGLLALLVSAQALTLVLLLGVRRRATLLQQDLTHIRRKSDDTQRHVIGIATHIGWSDDYTKTRIVTPGEPDA